jgi:hypothetical protein
MKRIWNLALLMAVTTVVHSNASDHPVTSKTARSPSAEAESRWVIASIEASLPPFARRLMPLTEAGLMLQTVQTGESLGPGQAWYKSSQRRHDWDWLSGQFDRNLDRRITSDELSAAPVLFGRLDRDGNGVVTGEDLDWTEKSTWVQKETQSLWLLRQIDRDGDGRITGKEWNDYFQRFAGEKAFLNANDIREAMLVERARGRKSYEDYWVRSLFEGDLGSPLEGPRVGDAAPDFTLTDSYGLNPISLSQFRGNKPVVLVFGSFT